MNHTSIQDLKCIAEKIGKTSSKEEQISLLTQGFQLFSEETNRLENAYQNLKDLFHKVNHKLEETNKHLASKVQELHVLTSYLDNILSHMAQGLIFINATGYLTTYNRAAEIIFEKRTTEVLFQLFKEKFSDDTFGFSLKEAIKNKKVPHTSFFSLSFPDGKVKKLEAEFSFIPNEPSAIIILIRDITELRKLQMIADRKDSMQALGEMAAQVAHEIRNPLGGIKGFSALLQRDVENEPEKLRLTKYIIEGVNTLERLVTQVLNYSRPLQLELKEVNLSILLAELQESLIAEKFIHKNIDFYIHRPKKVLAAVDSGLLKSALKNLMINALQAMPKKGILEVSLEEEDRKAIIKIKDTGIGIQEEHMKKLFSPFFSTKADGNGLGLSETHKVIHAHGGEILVESEVNKGTVFTIKIPL